MRFRYAAYVAFFLSGASSLIFQNIWSRMLHHVFGATTVAVSTVITIFMAGLGLGAWIGGRYADRIKHPIITYAAAELGVGLWAILVPMLVDPEGWLATVNSTLRTSMGAESVGFMLARFACVVPILLIPTTLMGTTLPLLARYFVQAEQRAGVVASRVGALYAINTFGAVGGVLLSGFVLMPLIGLSATNVVALSLNFVLGFGIIAFRRTLLRGTWTPGEKLQFLPSREVGMERQRRAELTDPAREEAARAEQARVDAEAQKAEAQKSEADRAATEKAEADRRAAEREAEKRAAEQQAAEKKAAHDEIALPIPPIARKAAFFAFAASGAAALCYEVVWTRALAMTIGSSIYSFTLILATFLIGIAGGSALLSALIMRGRSRFTVTAIAALVLLALANSPWAVEEGLVTYFVLMVVLAAPILVIWGAVVARSRGMGDEGFQQDPQVPAMLMLAVPVGDAIFNGLYIDGYLSTIVAGVVTVLTLFVVSIIGLRRYPVLLIAVTQLLIAVATFTNYWFLDEIPFAFAQLVTSLEDLPSQVGTVQFFMFFTAGLCTLPAAIGMGAMFPLTIRVWTVGGARVGRDVGVVYTGNTVGSIVGAWLPGFVLLPAWGMEATLHAGMFLNLGLALMMLIASAAESPGAPTPAAASKPSAKTKTKAGKKEKGKGKPTEPAASPAAVPLWHSVTIYVLAPLIPALIAVMWLHLRTTLPGEYLRWNPSHMTLGVFRLSLAEDVLDPETWGEPDLVYYHDGLSTTVTVERWGRHYAMKNNGKVDASNGDDMPTQIMVAGFPLLMHRDGPEDLNVAVIGFGSGVTVGTALQFPVASVDSIELERSIPEASQFFADVNHLEYPLEDWPYVQMDRLTMINDDGRNYLASTDKKYDIIMSEPSNPWITGVSDLFTTDHFRITKRSLEPGGVYCQWVQLYELSPENIKTIYRTFASQFEHVVVFTAEDLSSDTVMLGSDEPLPLDLERIRRPFADPQARDELERAYVHSPFDVLARVILANRDEVLAYTEIEQRLRGGEWEDVPESSNAGACELPDCRREPAPLNTDDNALIEFRAPRDLIGFQRYEGYLANIYSPDWPYANLMDNVTGFGEGDEAARNYAEMAMALVGHGRKGEAGEFIRRAHEEGSARETVVAAEVLRMLMSDEHEPAVAIEPPVPGPQMDARTARRLSEGFESVRQAVDMKTWNTALAAMEEIPAPIRLHSGPGMRFLGAYLYYKAAEGSPSRYRSAIEQLEDLVRSDEEYVRRHPEMYYFLARSHDAEFNFDKALRNMRMYVETAVVPRQDSPEIPEPPIEEAPTTDEPGEAPKDVHPTRT